MDELEKLLIEGFCESFFPEQTSLLEKKENARNILIYDYLKTLPVLDTPAELLRAIVKTYHKVNPALPKDFKFKDPKTRMLLDLYKQGLSANFHALASRLETKTELKQLYCLDEVYKHLNYNRRNMINLSGNLVSILNFSIEHYTNQLIALEMGDEINEFSELADKVDYSNIKMKQIKYLKSKSKKVEDNAKKASDDFEVIQMIRASNDLIANLNKRISDGVKTLLDKVDAYRKDIRSVSEKKFLSREDYLRIVDAKENLEDLQKVLSDFGKPDNFSKLIQKYSFFIQSHYSYLVNHDHFEDIVLRQKEINEIAKIIKSRREKSVLEFFRHGRVWMYLTRTERNLGKIMDFYDNRYFRQRLYDEKDNLVGPFGEVELNPKWSERIYSKYKRVSEKFGVLQSNVSTINKVKNPQDG
jgi:hypothetical protein